MWWYQNKHSKTRWQTMLTDFWDCQWAKGSPSSLPWSRSTSSIICDTKTYWKPRRFADLGSGPSWNTFVSPTLIQQQSKPVLMYYFQLLTNTRTGWKNSDDNGKTWRVRNTIWDNKCCWRLGNGTGPTYAAWSIDCWTSSSTLWIESWIPSVTKLTRLSKRTSVHSLRYITTDIEIKILQKQSQCLLLNSPWPIIMTS